MTSSAGGSAFIGDFPVGGVADVTATVSIGCSLTNLVAGSCPTLIQETPLTSGSIAPHGTPVPEPSTLSLILLAVGSLAWCRVLT